MISLNDIARLINQIDTLLDDANGDIYSVYVDGERKRDVHMSLNGFLSEFIDFDINVKNDDPKYPFTFFKRIHGVRFYTFTNPAQVLLLINTMPEQHKYITRKLQRETA